MLTMWQCSAGPPLGPAPVSTESEGKEMCRWAPRWWTCNGQRVTVSTESEGNEMCRWAPRWWTFGLGAAEAVLSASESRQSCRLMGSSLYLTASSESSCGSPHCRWTHRLTDQPGRAASSHSCREVGVTRDVWWREDLCATHGQRPWR